MNKKTILSVLLALVAMTGQGQEKSGLNLCLRDKATGDWLIGLFDDYAVFDCEIWEYAKADTLKGEYMLRRGKEALKVKFLDKPSCPTIPRKTRVISLITVMLAVR